MIIGYFMLIKKSKNYSTIKLFYKDDFGCIQTVMFFFFTSNLEMNIDSLLHVGCEDYTSFYTIKLCNIISGGYLGNKLSNFIDKFVLTTNRNLGAYIFYNKVKYIFHDISLEIHYDELTYIKGSDYMFDIILKARYVQTQY